MDVKRAHVPLFVLLNISSEACGGPNRPWARWTRGGCDGLAEGRKVDMLKHSNVPPQKIKRLKKKRQRRNTSPMLLHLSDHFPERRAGSAKPKRTAEPPTLNAAEQAPEGVWTNSAPRREGVIGHRSE